MTNLFDGQSDFKDKHLQLMNLKIWMNEWMNEFKTSTKFPQDITDASFNFIT